MVRTFLDRKPDLAHLFLVQNHDVLPRFNTGYDDASYSALARHVDGGTGVIVAMQWTDDSMNLEPGNRDEQRWVPQDCLRTYYPCRNLHRQLRDACAVKRRIDAGRDC